MSIEEELDSMYEDFLEIACMTPTGAKQATLKAIDLLLDRALDNWDESEIKYLTELKKLAEQI